MCKLETCRDCKRPIERDNLRGKPDGDRGYCLGFDTCIQAHPQMHARDPERIAAMQAQREAYLRSCWSSVPADPGA